MKHIEVVP